MPNYCEIQTESHGQFFLKCGTKEVAGRTSNTSISAGDDAILVSSYAFDGFASPESGSLHSAGFTLQLSVPLLPPAVASTFNTLNLNDKLTKLTLKIVDGVGTMRNTVVGQYIAEDGVLITSSISDSVDKDTLPTLNLTMVFDKITFDNLLTNTSGTLKTSGSGF